MSSPNACASRRARRVITTNWACWRRTKSTLVVLTAVRERGLQPLGTAVEHYLDLDEVGRTEVAIPIHAH